MANSSLVALLQLAPYCLAAANISGVEKSRVSLVSNWRLLLSITDIVRGPDCVAMGATTTSGIR